MANDTTEQMEFHVQYSLYDTEHQNRSPSSYPEFHRSQSVGSQLDKQINQSEHH